MDVKYFLYKTFSMAQQSLCSVAKYNRCTWLSYVPDSAGSMDMVDAAMTLESGIDPYKGLPEDHICKLQAEQYKGPDIGVPDYFDFNDDQSITTTKHKSGRYATSKLTTKMQDIDIHSIYEPEGSIVAEEMTFMMILAKRRK